MCKTESYLRIIQYFKYEKETFNKAQLVQAHFYFVNLKKNKL